MNPRLLNVLLIIADARDEADIRQKLGEARNTSFVVRAAATLSEALQQIAKNSFDVLPSSEKVLLEQTLHGSIKALVEILSLANPLAFGRATRVRKIVEELINHFQIRERWPVELAAMLPQIGSVTLPPATLNKRYKGEALTGPEKVMVDRTPTAVEKCLSHIPRLPCHHSAPLRLPIRASQATQRHRHRRRTPLGRPRPENCSRF
jgi:response regulator RpfG family c-di-GMP phosphodiesterase